MVKVIVNVPNTSSALVETSEYFCPRKYRLAIETAAVLSVVSSRYCRYKHPKPKSYRAIANLRILVRTPVLRK